MNQKIGSALSLLALNNRGSLRTEMEMQTSIIVEATGADTIEGIARAVRTMAAANNVSALVLLYDERTQRMICPSPTICNPESFGASLIYEAAAAVDGVIVSMRSDTNRLVEEMNEEANYEIRKSHDRYRDMRAKRVFPTAATRTRPSLGTTPTAGETATAPAAARSTAEPGSPTPSTNGLLNIKIGDRDFTFAGREQAEEIRRDAMMAVEAAEEYLANVAAKEFAAEKTDGDDADNNQRRRHNRRNSPVS